ncbi:MAG: hypothetical protein F4Z57_18865 [Gemmatimonadetes bacterium]|nr:hypothetical protein [Gemmatimonadota bacterium]MYC70838.1 hypothetical protein [Gemmatimonadota bacterium]MYI60627.1 hypothetical protein [Gemmatimonadota bacterium]
MAEPIAMPRLGWTMEEGTLVEWLKADGDTVEAGEILFTVESDKALNEIETFSGGILHIPSDAPQPGDTVPVGTLLGYLLQPGEEMPTAPPPAPAAEPVPTPAEPASVAKPEPVPTATLTRSAGPTISPRARRVAAELEVEWRVLTGSGRTGRIVERDVRAAAARSSQAVPAILTTEADATELVTLRPQLKLEGAPAPAYHHLIAKLVVVALADYPQLNASETEAVHLSLSVDTGEDLATPVIRDAHTKNWAELAAAARSLALQARRRTLGPKATQSGTFAIANFGMYGIDAFTPILRPPYRATLGLGRIAERPAVREGRVVPRALISLSLTVESGLLENGAAVRFLDRLRSLIEQPELGLKD